MSTHPSIAGLFHSENVTVDAVAFPSIEREDFRSDSATADTALDNPDNEQRLTSLLMELPDRIGVLHDVLRYFWKHEVNIRRIESRPSQLGKFDFFVDVEAAEEDGRIDSLLADLKEFGVQKLLTLGEKEGTSIKTN